MVCFQLVKRAQLRYGVNNKRRRFIRQQVVQRYITSSKLAFFLPKYNKHLSVNIFSLQNLQYLFKNQTHIYNIIEKLSLFACWKADFSQKTAVFSGWNAPVFFQKNEVKKQGDNALKKILVSLRHIKKKLYFCTPKIYH